MTITEKRTVMVKVGEERLLKKDSKFEYFTRIVSITSNKVLANMMKRRIGTQNDIPISQICLPPNKYDRVCNIMINS